MKTEYEPKAWKKAAAYGLVVSLILVLIVVPIINTPPSCVSSQEICFRYQYQSVSRHFLGFGGESNGPIYHFYF